MKDKAKSLIILITIAHTSPIFANPCLDSLTESEKNYKFYSAIHQNDKNAVLDLLKAGVDVNASFMSEETFLILAFHQNNPDIINILLDHKNTDLSFVNDHEDTLLMIALRYVDDIDIIKRLSKHPLINVNARNKSKQTALIIASKVGKTEAVRILLDDPKTDVNAADENGGTSLIWAVIKGEWVSHDLLVRGDTRYLDIVELLLSRQDLNINYMVHGGWTALMWAVSLCRDSRFVAKLLDDRRTIIDVENHEGRTAITIASEYKISRALQLLYNHQYMELERKKETLKNIEELIITLQPQHELTPTQRD